MAKDNTSGGQSAKSGELHPGYRLPPFKKGDRRTPLSAHAINPVVGVANAVLALKVKRRQAIPDADGNFQNDAKVEISDDGIVIELIDAPGGDTGIPNTEQSYTASCPSGSTGSTVSVTVLAATLFADTQLQADALALELATSRALLALVCTPIGVQGANYMISDGVETSAGGYAFCGGFTLMQGVARWGLAVLYSDFTLHPAYWPMYSTSGFAPAAIGAIAPHKTDGSVYCFGTCERIFDGGAGAAGYQSALNYIQCTPNGGMSTGFLVPRGPGSGPMVFPGGTHHSRRDSNSRIVTHSTGTWDATNTAGVVVLDTDGELFLALPFQNNAGTLLAPSPLPGVSAVHLARNNSILLIGEFNATATRMKYSGTLIASRYVMPLSSGYAYSSGFADTGTGFNMQPNACLVQSGSTLQGYIFGAGNGAGTGLKYNGSTQTWVIKTDTAGNIDSTFNANVPFGGAGGPIITGVFPQVVAGVLKFLVTGIFTTVGGNTACGITRLNPDGSVDTSFVSPTSIGSGVVDAHGYPNGCVVHSTTGQIALYGNFTSLSGLTRNYLALLDANGNILGSG